MNAFDLTPKLCQYFQDARRAYNGGEFERAIERLYTISGLYTIHEETLKIIPESRMIYRESMQLLGEVFLATGDKDAWREVLTLLFDQILEVL